MGDSDINTIMLAVLTTLWSFLYRPAKKNAWIYASVVALIVLVALNSFRYFELRSNISGSSVLYSSAILLMFVLTVVFYSWKEKHGFTAEKLNEEMNKFSVDAIELYLLCGDLDFLGKNINAMSKNSQYKELKKHKGKINILCKDPKGDSEEINRLGKIIEEIGDKATIRTLTEGMEAGIKVRGRMKTMVQGEQKILLFEKPTNKSSVNYKKVEMDDAHAFNLLFQLWENADEVNKDKRRVWQKTYNNG